MFRLLSLRHDFPQAWHQLMGGAGGGNTGSSAGFAVVPQHFPYFLVQRTPTVDSVQLFLLSQQEASGGGPAKAPVGTGGLGMTVNGTAAGAWTAAAGTNLATSTVPLTGPAVGPWTLAVTGGKLDPKQVGDVLMLVKYKVT
jgi:hypothetical protein